MSDLTVTKTSIGLLALLDVALKFKMSLLRSAGAIGEGDKNSFFEKMHVVQLLTSEYTPVTSIVIALFYYMKQQQEKPRDRKLSTRQRMTMLVAVCSRFVFVLRAYDNSVNANGAHKSGQKGAFSPYGLVGATLSYLSLFALTIELLLM